MYNAEKYINVCLESILGQTLKDFEVIVVDDCSTDSSPAIVESYLERFGGRLKIISLPQNTGSGAVPRNVGVERACGKYVYFVDNDDMLTDAALETLYNLAEEYQADVVSMTSGFTCDENPLPKNIVLRNWLPARDSPLKKPILDVENFKERLQKFFASQFEWVPWSRFLRREFLLENEITFPHITIADDVIWNWELIFMAKRWLRINVPLYIQRYVPDSTSRRKRTPEQVIIFRINPLVSGIEHLDKFMRKLDYFEKNPTLRLQLLNFFLNLQLDEMKDVFKNLNANVLYEIFLREFKKAGSTQPALIAQLLLINNLYRNELMKK